MDTDTTTTTTDTPELAARRRQAIKLVEHSTKKLDKVTNERNAVLYMAHVELGLSLRDLADASHLSHTQVKRIVDRELELA